MWRSFSTRDLGTRDRFRTWQEICRERLPPVEFRKTGDDAFEASWQIAKVGDLMLNRTAYGAHRFESGPRQVRGHSKQDRVAVVVRLAGTARCVQHDRAVQQGPGDLMVLDGNAPLSMEFSERSRAVAIDMPREKLERVLGSVRHFANMPLTGASSGAFLARVYIEELMRVYNTLTPQMAVRMAGVGIDLIVASLAERMARDTPRPLQNTMTVRRAKAYVEAHLDDISLDPPSLAAAVGVSLRRLQELFHERGQHISDWIWQRRLQAAAERLVDPGLAHVQVGALAYGCGFANQAHFSKRFRDRFNVSPSDYRRAAHAPGSPTPAPRGPS